MGNLDGTERVKTSLVIQITLGTSAPSKIAMPPGRRVAMGHNLSGSGYCSKCNQPYISALICGCGDSNRIWNEAIEACAKRIAERASYGMDFDVRTLKREVPHVP